MIKSKSSKELKISYDLEEFPAFMTETDTSFCLKKIFQYYNENPRKLKIEHLILNIYEQILYRIFNEIKSLYTYQKSDHEIKFMVSGKDRFNEDYKFKLTIYLFKKSELLKE